MANDYLEYNNSDSPNYPTRDPGELNVVDRIKNDAANKAALPKAPNDGVLYPRKGIDYMTPEDIAKIVDIINQEAILEGDGAEYHTLAPTTLSFRSENPLATFLAVEVDGEVIDESNYELEEGSTIVKLPPDYLKTLDQGDHEIRIISSVGKCKANFKVAVPELNEYGFYYNQPYSAYVGSFGGTTVFFLREDGTMDFTVIEGGYSEVCSYTIEDSNITVYSSNGTFTGSISEEGIYCNEVYTTFKIGNTSIAADEDYIYIYNEDLGGYEVKCINKTKSSYCDIKTGINGIDTVKLADKMFLDMENRVYNDNMVIAPKIPESVAYIGDWAFASCTALETVTLPNSIKCIGSHAFDTCKNLTDITIGSGIEEINEEAFIQCKKINCVRYNGTLVQWCNINFVSSGISVNPCYYGAKLYINNELVDNIVIPDSVTNICNYAFTGCSSLTGVTIHHNISNIGDVAFTDCTNLASISFDGTIAQWNAITKGLNWNAVVPATHVHCLDGDVAL